MENVLTAAIDHFPEPDTKPRAKKAAKGIPHGVYNHASAVLIKGIAGCFAFKYTPTAINGNITSRIATGNFVDDILVEGNRGLRVPLLLENYAGGDSSKEMIDTENEEHDIKTEVECSVKEASQSGSSFLARLAKASPLVHSQPIDQVELEGFVALPSHLQRNAHNEVMTGTAGKIEHSRNVGILNRFQQFSETKDISFVAEGKMKNYQKRV